MGPGVGLPQAAGGCPREPEEAGAEQDRRAGGEEPCAVRDRRTSWEEVERAAERS